MKISSFAVRNPTTTIVVVLALVIFGALALQRLETDEFPAIHPPVIAVSIPYPGASPPVVEREVVTPLEESFSAISGVDGVTSSAMDGFAQITVTFAFGKDLQQAAQDIRDRIAENRRRLPAEIEEPVLVRSDPADAPIMSLALSSTRVPLAELTRIADPLLIGALRNVSGVADVEISGGLERELTVELRPGALSASGLGVHDVVRALEAQNLAAPVGRISGPLVDRTIRLEGRLESPEAFAALAIGSRGGREGGGRTIALGDVARVYDGLAEPRSLAFFNGDPAIGIDVKKATGASTTRVSQDLRARAEAIARGLPEGVELRIVRDSGTRVEQSVHDVQSSLLEGAGLTVLVVFLFLLSWRSTLITGLALPVSVLASFIAVWALGFTLNTMSLLGLSLAIGILVDDAIVVRENIVRHMEMGKDHVRAALDGTAEIGLAVAATTLAIVVVFVPVAFMGGLAQQWFAPFALTIASSVLVSLFVSFSLDPMLSAIWRDPEVEGRRSWLTRHLQPFDAWLTRLTRRYERVIGWALGHPVVMTFIVLAAFGAAVAMPVLGFVGVGFLPQQDMSQFGIHLETMPSSSLAYTRSRALEAASMIARHPEVAYTYTSVGGVGGATDEANIYVRLLPRAERPAPASAVAAALRAELSRLAGVRAALEGGSSDKEIQLAITGPDPVGLARVADAVADAIAGVPGVVDVGLSSRGQKPELDVEVDRKLAANLGLSVADVAQALRTAFAGVDAGDWVDPTGRTRDVMVRLARESRTSPADLETLPLLGAAGPQGAPVPLGQVAHVRSGLGPAQIWHIDRARVISAGANTDGRPLSEVMPEIGARLSALHLPAGYAIREGGDVQDQHEVFSRILGSLGIAALLMYGILVIQFRSFLDPIPIMASLPLALIGVMVALMITGSTLNLMSLIGVVLLMGVVAKNAILLIDFANWSIGAGRDPRAAIIEAGAVRLRPILMTSVAIIAGMLPVAIGRGEGGDFRAPLGRAVIGGVITATLLTLLAIPTFHHVLCGWRARFLARRSGRSSPAATGSDWPDSTEGTGRTGRTGGTGRTGRTGRTSGPDAGTATVPDLRPVSDLRPVVDLDDGSPWSFG